MIDNPVDELLSLIKNTFSQISFDVLVLLRIVSVQFGWDLFDLTVLRFVIAHVFLHNTLIRTRTISAYSPANLVAVD